MPNRGCLPLPVEPSSGSSLVKMQTENSELATFRYFRVDVLALTDDDYFLRLLAQRESRDVLSIRQSSSLAVLNRSELAMTLTEDNAMAAAATTGESSIPKNG